MGHLGADRITLLVDGQLPAAEADRSWAHVLGCTACGEAVAREGWVKSQLAVFSSRVPAPGPDLRGMLSHSGEFADCRDQPRGWGRPGRVAALGGGAMGMLVAGFVALSVAPGAVTSDLRTPPTGQFRTPANQVSGAGDSGTGTPGPISSNSGISNSGTSNTVGAGNRPAPRPSYGPVLGVAVRVPTAETRDRLGPRGVSAGVPGVKMVP